MSLSHAFPTPSHADAAAAIVDFAQSWPVRAALLVNSCARGVATPQSDLDMALLVDPALPADARLAIEAAWAERYRRDSVFRRLEANGPFARVHLDVIDGQYTPTVWDDGGGPDGFELEIGNHLAYAVALWQDGTAFAELRARWLPYYDEALRAARLRMARDAVALDIERVRSYARRDIPFYAFDRLYHGAQELLQAVFIARRVYPLAYNKWIHEQVVGWLGLPELYDELAGLIALGRMERGALLDRADRLAIMLDRYAPDDAVAVTAEA